MKAQTGKFLESCRVTSGPFGSDRSLGFNGAFYVPIIEAEKSIVFTVVCSDGTADIGDGSSGWEHVSVSLQDRTPTWEEMAAIKNLFWDEHECVIQFHPPRAEYVNNHAHCLHLWKPTTTTIPLPPSYLVGDKSRGVLTRDESIALARTIGVKI